MYHFKLLTSDRAENSIMQTITIAVSAILIAAGLVTAPGLINNARDNNATGDLANIAYAQEFVLGSNGNYAQYIDSADELSGAGTNDGNNLQDIANTDGGVKFTLSGEADIKMIVCDAPDSGYVISTLSKSEKVFYRSSESAKTAQTLAEITIPSCIDPADLANLHQPSGPVVPPSNNFNTIISKVYLENPDTPEFTWSPSMPGDLSAVSTVPYVEVPSYPMAPYGDVTLKGYIFTAGAGDVITLNHNGSPVATITQVGAYQLISNTNPADKAIQFQNARIFTADPLVWSKIFDGNSSIVINGVVVNIPQNAAMMAKYAVPSNATATWSFDPANSQIGVNPSDVFYFNGMPTGATANNSPLSYLFRTLNDGGINGGSNYPKVMTMTLQHETSPGSGVYTTIATPTVNVYYQSSTDNIWIGATPYDIAETGVLGGVVYDSGDNWRGIINYNGVDHVITGPMQWVDYP